MPLHDISSRDIDQFISSPKSKHSASLYYRTFKAAFNKAVIWDYIKENPFCKIKSPKTSSSPPVFISKTELILILNNTTNQLYKDIFATVFYTGMRLGELLNMRWDWIDFEQNTFTIKSSDQFISKNKREELFLLILKLKIFFSPVSHW